MNNKSFNSTTISKIFKSRNILLDLFEKRGFDISQYKNFTINEIHILYTNEQLDMLLENNNNGKKLYVKYHILTKIRPPNILDYNEELYINENIIDKKDDLIIVTKDSINEGIRYALDVLYKKDGYYVNIYNYNKYLFNILNHEKVPEHRILTDKEKKDIQKKYNIVDDSKFPEISRFDPVAIAIGIRPGEVCEIKRSSPNSIKSLYYRICVS